MCSAEATFVRRNGRYCTSNEKCISTYACPIGNVKHGIRNLRLVTAYLIHIELKKLQGTQALLPGAPVHVSLALGQAPRPDRVER